MPPRRRVFLSDIQRKEKKSKSVGGEKLCQGARGGASWYKKNIGIEKLDLDSLAWSLEVGGGEGSV